MDTMFVMIMVVELFFILCGICVVMNALRKALGTIFRGIVRGGNSVISKVKSR